MKLRSLATLLLAAAPLVAQAPTHSALATWTASTDTGGTVNLYRATGACASNPTFTLVKSGVPAGGPYTDPGLGAGTFSYHVTAVVGGVEGPASNCASVTFSAAAPTITWATPASINSGTALSATQLNATASTPGTFSYSPALGSVPAAGVQTLTVTFTPTDTVNFTTATKSVTITVLPQPPTNLVVAATQ